MHLNELRGSEELQEFLIDEVTELSGAERVLRVPETSGEFRIAGALVPKGEDTQVLLHAITPWLDEARRTRAVRLRHGADGADAVDQRSCLVAPLVAQNRLLGFLYADIEGAFGRFHDTDRDLMAMLAAQAAVALDNVHWAEGLERKVEERTAELTQALEQQTATAEILKVISSSPTDTQPVFDAIVHSVARLFGRKAGLRTVEPDGLRRRARSYAVSADEFYSDDLMPINEESIVGWAVIERRALQVPDTQAVGAPAYARANAAQLAYRSSTPLLHGGAAIGAISVGLSAVVGAKFARPLLSGTAGRYWRSLISSKPRPGRSWKIRLLISFRRAGSKLVLSH